MSAAESIVPHTDVARVPGIVQALRRGFESGRTRPLEWRREQLRAIEAMMKEAGGELVEAMQADLGKPGFEARAMDIGATKLEAANARRKLRRWTRSERPGFAPLPGKMRVVREPLGVVLIIAPWNYPVQLLLSPLVGAIAAGNCAVLKPSEVTAHTSEALARLVPRYLDPEAIALVEGGVEETSALLAERFDHIFYTGNGTVGRVVMEAAAKHLTPVTLELGGKSPCIVDRDVDVEVSAKRIAWGKWVNAGQTCVAPDYVLVHREREVELVDALRKTVAEFYGSDPKASPHYARVVNSRHTARVSRFVKDGEAAVGGEVDVDENYVAPTVLRGVSMDSDCMREEIFGPVLPIVPVDGIDEALAVVNAREKPLALYVFSRDAEVQKRVIANTSSGGACVNGTVMQLAHPEAPFGGVGPSGMGAYHGRYSFETFSHRRAVLTRRFRPDLKFLYPPYGGLKDRLIERFF